MLTHHIETAANGQCKFALELVGVAAHVYMDTFSHYGFSGISSSLNSVDGDTCELCPSLGDGRSCGGMGLVVAGRHFVGWISMPGFLDTAPDSDTVTDYDRQCFILYIMLTDADAAGASWQETCEWLFQSETGQNSKMAKSRYHSHLRRARWMTTTGYRQIL